MPTPMAGWRYEKISSRHSLFSSAHRIGCRDRNGITRRSTKYDLLWALVFLISLIFSPVPRAPSLPFDQIDRQNNKTLIYDLLSLMHIASKIFLKEKLLIWKSRKFQNCFLSIQNCSQYTKSLLPLKAIFPSSRNIFEAYWKYLFWL